MGPRHPPPAPVPRVDDVVALLWQQQVLGCLQRIWQWRQGVQDEDNPWKPAIARSALSASMRSAYAHVALCNRPTEAHATSLHRLLGLQHVQLSTASPPSPSPKSSSDQFLLFFDGGSRGNPGAGGSGSIVVRVDAFGDRPVIVWAAAMSLASASTTNNQAEYFVLVTGLRFAPTQCC